MSGTDFSPLGMQCLLASGTNGGICLTGTVYQELKVLWDYMRLDIELRPSDCIVGFGCINDTIPVRCAQLYRDGFAPRVLFSGGLGRNTLGRWTQTEAEHFADIAVKQGVPETAILLEDRSTNSAENILFTREMLEQAGLAQGRLICVHKPFMTRRLYAAMKVYWPEADAIFTSPQITLEEHIRNSMDQGLTEQSAIDIIVGDFQRMEVYARKGYQIPQEIPPRTWEAFYNLVEQGFTSELVEPAKN